jgi:hypothetical protein
MRYRIGLALMLVAMLAGPASAENSACDVTITIPTDGAPGVVLTLDAIFTSVEPGVTHVLHVAGRRLRSLAARSRVNGLARLDVNASGVR